MVSRDRMAAAAELLEACHRAGLKLVTAESCTGGLVAGCLTSIPGSSEVYDRGFVVYSNRAKQDLLGVPGRLIETVGAVSEEVARAMADGAIARSEGTLSVAVTGIAGPGGATPGKPVGLVPIAARFSNDEIMRCTASLKTAPMAACRIFERNSKST